MFDTLFSFISILAIAGCSGPLTPGPQAQLPVTSVAPAGVTLPMDSGISQESLSVIRDQAAWDSFWKSIYVNQSPAPPVPTVDFTKEMIVVAAAGIKPSSGYSMQIQSATETKGEVTVTVEAMSPGPRCVGLTVMTSPVALARLPRRTGPVKFEVIRRTRAC